MRIVIVAFTAGAAWAQQRQATEQAPGWHVADYAMDRTHVRLTFFDDAKAAAAVPILAASPHVADVRLDQPRPQLPRGRRRS
jgi:hypothetical protein